MSETPPHPPSHGWDPPQSPPDPRSAPPGPQQQPRRPPRFAPPHPPQSASEPQSVPPPPGRPSALPGPYQAPAGHGPWPAGAPGSDGSTWAMVAHLVGVVFACTAWLPSLVVYLVAKGRSPFVRHHAAEALNLQLTLFFPYVVGAGLFVGLGFSSPDLAWIGTAVTVAVWLVCLVFGTLAATAAARDSWYRYPIAFHLVK
ncbi:DUF4870 domain-containing protein [Thermobifida cellulosilytica]|nr:DUF4870 domain-containing protein [Thermobifida cellulosilytica]